jgi:hypothetical protein
MDPFYMVTTDISKIVAFVGAILTNKNMLADLNLSYTIV